MVEFSYSDSSPTFRFSAKTSTIILPSAVQQMSPEDQAIVQRFCTLVREIYISKVVEFSTSTVGKKICAISIRHSSITEAIDRMREELTPEVFNPIYSQFQSLSQNTKSSRRNTILEKPRSRSTTALDHIEDLDF